MIRNLHIEGMDLAGKSTATKSILYHLGNYTSVRHNTIQSKSDFHRIVDNLRIDKKLESDELGELYYQVLKDDISRYQKPEVNTIQDSTILLRSLAWYASLEHPILKKFQSLIVTHPKFDCSVVLTASIQVRQIRLQSRIDEGVEKVAEDDLLVIKQPELFLKMEENLLFYATNYFNAKVLDTTLLNKSQVSSEIIRLMDL
jgi:thymidylate kinase